jgi:hypothetical protein
VIVRIFVMGLLLVGCERKPTPAPEQPAAPAPTSPVAAATASALPTAATNAASIPVEEDFEADAEGLTAANLSSKLDELEKEISAP